MPMAVSVKPLKHYKIWLKFADGVEGIAHLSHLVGKGVFAAWNDEKAFNNVHVGSSGEAAWSDEIDICPDSSYLRATGKKPEDIFPALREEAQHHESLHGLPPLV